MDSTVNLIRLPSASERMSISHIASRREEVAYTWSGGVGTPADESVVTGVLLSVDVVWTQVIGIVVRPAAQRQDVSVDVDADAAGGPLAVVEALSDGPRTGVLGRAQSRVADVPLPLRLIAAH